ncbi:MAG: hypothetical protein H6741_07285 [Alphaproteobacteria bacterium]|nr:hypothetical protein [Alphaproteobacteria bacterium]
MRALSTLVLLIGCADDVETPDAAPAPPSFEAATDPLGELGAQALSLAPDWIQDDLALSFARVSEARRDELAALIVDLDDPWLTDEVAFSIATISPEVLDDPGFYPELIVDNAEWVYRVDPELAYVEIVDVGEPGVDAGYYSTTRYVFEVDGELVEKELDRELYYWYVVHPRIEDERPYYIDAWAECTSGTLECAASPEEGMIWREFLWQGAAETCPEEGFCPVLVDVLPEVDAAWGGEGGSEATGAIGDIVRYMLSRDVDTETRWLTFGAHDERSIQPNRIYGLGRGNCGEWADMTTAISRTALLPNLNVTPSSWDHTWNAFWDEAWIPWEPVNFWVEHAYGIRYSAYATRGDASMFLQTADYTDETFEMQVHVEDEGGRPVDGAIVSVYSPFESDGQTYWWPAGELATDPDGVAIFTLGSDAQYTMRVDSSVGGYPQDSGQLTYASNGIATGETDEKTVSVYGFMPNGVPGLHRVGGGGAASLVVEGLPEEGRLVSTSRRYGESMSQPTWGPQVQLFVVDEANYQAFVAGEDFDAVYEGEGSTGVDPDQAWYVVVANSFTADTAAIGTLRAEVSPLAAAEFEGSDAGELRYRLAPGQHAALRMAP